MKIEKKLVLVFMVSLVIVLFASCASTGEFMPISKEEVVVGTVQTSFAVPKSFFSLKSVKDSVNTRAYIHLMEEAGEKYPGSIDLRDIVWVTGATGILNTEISATAKVVQIE